MDTGFIYFYYSLIFCSEEELIESKGYTHKEWRELEAES